MLQKLNPLLALAAGLIGGLASRYVTPFAVQAQAPAPQVLPIPIPPPPQPSAPAEIKAQSFTLVDGNGNVVGTFRPLVSTWRNGQADGVVLVDKNGHEMWRATTSMVRPVSQ